MEKPTRVSPPEFTFNPVGQTLASVHRYSAGQWFKSPPRLGNQFLYCQTIQNSAKWIAGACCKVINCNC
eukprot:5212023-Ditylum_brightwellii.AAC.1